MQLGSLTSTKFPKNTCTALNSLTKASRSNTASGFLRNNRIHRGRLPFRGGGSGTTPGSQATAGSRGVIVSNGTATPVLQPATQPHAGQSPHAKRSSTKTGTAKETARANRQSATKLG